MDTENTEEVRRNLERRRVTLNLDAWLQLDQRRTQTLQKVRRWGGTEGWL